MASADGLSQDLSDCKQNKNLTMKEEMERETEDDEEEEEDDENDETWDEMDTECENCVTCLFCSQNFKTMAVALEHCKIDHNFDLSGLKNKFNMDCYSYICLINYVRREGISSEMLLSFKEPQWLNGEYLAPVIQDDPWLMFDFDGLEPPVEDGSLTIDQNYHVVNSENGLVTLTEQHFAQLQHKIKDLTLQVEKRDEALTIATEQIHKMKDVTHHLICSESTEDQDSIQKTVMKIKTLGDDGYFNSYSHFGIHLEMLSDKVRTMKYKNAIMKNASLISDKVVLDVGCGTAILSMFAASAGALKVYGIDKSEIIFDAMDIIRENNLTNKIDLVHDKVEDASLPVEKVDVIISEWMGYFLLYEGMLNSVITARDRYLKTDGLLLPNKCTLYIMGLSDPVNHKHFLGFWSDVYGFKMSCLIKEALQQAHIFQVEKHTVATTSATVLDLDLHTIDNNCMNFESDFSLEVTMDGNLTALCGYFDAFFDLPNSEVLSTNPESDKTHWKQTVFFLRDPIPITKGSVIKGRIKCEKPSEDDRSLIIAITLNDREKMIYYLM